MAELTLTVVPGDPAVRRHFGVAWGALRALEGDGLVIHDERIGRVLDLRADVDPVVTRFETMAAEAAERVRRPWWRVR